LMQSNRSRKANGFSSPPISRTRCIPAGHNPRWRTAGYSIAEIPLSVRYGSGTDLGSASTGFGSGPFALSPQGQYLGLWILVPDFGTWPISPSWARTAEWPLRSISGGRLFWQVW
jgi:hypothetical protein